MGPQTIVNRYAESVAQKSLAKSREWEISAQTILLQNCGGFVDRVVDEWFYCTFHLRAERHQLREHDHRQIVVGGDPEVGTGRAAPTVLADVRSFAVFLYLDNNGESQSESHTVTFSTEADRVRFVGQLRGGGAF